MMKVKPSEWVPVGGLKLEENALYVTKCGENKLVVAGPGAGKTELLAQRATYLLQTNTCSYPKKILAISFKRDAAYNLKQRVKLRCGDELSSRFDSYTFDAFAKIILDNFKNGLPSEFHFDSYHIIYNEDIVVDEYKALNLNIVNTTAKKELLKYHHDFTFTNDVKDNHEKNRLAVWKSLLRREPSIFTFGMVMRAAQKIIHSNHRIKEFLQETYSFIFLDEFQDTTKRQYSFFKTCFMGSNSIITAVGDDKQRIMLWAGAHSKVFDDFYEDFAAEVIPLKMNFRSAPRLVSLQNYLVEHLLGKEDFSTASSSWEENAGEAKVIFYQNEDQETADLFALVRTWVGNGVDPRDICILVKQRLQVYARTIISFFNTNGLKARDESQLQDIINNEVCVYVINVIKTIKVVAEPSVKSDIISFISNVRTELEDEDVLLVERQYSKFLSDINKAFPEQVEEEYLRELVDKIIALARKENISAYYPSLRSSDLDELLEHLKVEIWKHYQSVGDLEQAMDALLGKDTIPVMTIHKSKGLEYHTVVFIGLEDGAFWSFDKQPDEDKSAFFVALSRAKERVIFTFSNYRNQQQQSFDKIEELFYALDDSKIVELVDMNGD